MAVETMPNRGPLVATLDWPPARQICDIRLVLEEEGREHLRDDGQ